MPHHVIHYSEIGIKGDNRWMFERQLLDNVRAALGRPTLGVRREFGRLLADTRGLDPAVVEERLARLPGIAHLAPTSVVPLEMDAIRAEAVRLSAERGARSFRVETKRSDKRFPRTSVEVSREVGAAVAAATGMRVDLEQAEHTVWIELTHKVALLYTRRIPGVGGLPVGVSGRVVALLSGGIDSPVAAFKLIRRGCEAVLVHFHNQKPDDARVRDKILDLARALTRYQLRTRLWLVPFADVQSALIAAVPADARMIAYRRSMLRIGETILGMEGAKAFVTGDSVGQVASQTLDNLHAIHRVATHPVLSPLIGENKDEIVALARRLGTYEVSVRPYEDCCSFLVARHPVTRARLEPIEAAEARIPFEELAKDAVASAEIHDLVLDPPPTSPEATGDGASAVAVPGDETSRH